MQRAGYVAAAEAVRVIQSAASTYSMFLISVSFLIIGVVMLRGIFSKATAYLSLVAGIVGLASVIPSSGIPILGLIGLVSFILYALWFIAVGSKLYRLG
ncbi:MAG: hypothetical protein IH932_01490 [Thaumarchaeota archaeon]|nr:hypothetical protein [Nitrososphaerota archaeon]